MSNTIYSAAQLARIVNGALATTAYPSEPAGLYEPVSYTLQGGGKRLRPVYMLLAAQLMGARLEDILPAALALETFHNYTLLHDDLMDNADMRRGMPTVHRRWDANTAILSGDAMLEWAYLKMFDVSEGRSREAFAMFLRTALEVSEGQQHDMNFEHRLDVTLDEYLHMTSLKTGVLIACALGMGALYGGADDRVAGRMYDYGMLIGRAFQIQDDYLDTFGDAAVFGKRIGGDILEGKKTYLLVSAFEKASPELRREMELWLGRDDDPEGRIAFFTKVYTDLQLPALCERAIVDCFDQAETMLSQIEVNDEARRQLHDFTVSLLHRKS